MRRVLNFSKFIEYQIKIESDSIPLRDSCNAPIQLNTILS